MDPAGATRPIDFYSLSKEVTEVIGRSYANRGKLQVVAIRPARIVFPPQWPELEAWAPTCRTITSGGTSNPRT